MTNDFLLVLEVTWTGIDVPHYKVPCLCTSEKIERDNFEKKITKWSRSNYSCVLHDTQH